MKFFRFRCPAFLRFSAIAVLWLFLSGCEIDYQAGLLDETLNDEVPDLIMYNLKQTDVQESGRRIRITAERAEDFRKLRETRFYSTDFREYSLSGETLRSGHTDFGRLEDSNNAELEGNIRIDSRENGALVEADRLTWTHEKKQLDGPPEGRVSIIRDDGSALKGTDFHADFRDDIVEFRGQVSGTLVTGSDTPGASP